MAPRGRELFRQPPTGGQSRQSAHCGTGQGARQGYPQRGHERKGREAHPSGAKARQALMKIVRIETIPVLVPILPERAIKASGGYHTESPFLIVKVHTDAGITGLGEVSCTPIWSGEDHF